MFSGRFLLFAAILAVYLTAGVLYVSFTPAWQAPDEPAHYNYVRYLTANTGFPELTPGCYNEAYLGQLKSQKFPPGLSIDNICYEYHQPPLYYLLATPVFILSDGSLTALRLFSLLLGTGVVTLAFFTAKTIFPAVPSLALGTMAFVAFVPMHVAILSSVNNDALAELVLAAILFILARRVMLPDSRTTRNSLLIGVLLGIGLITKTTVYIGVPVIAVALLLIEFPRQSESFSKISWGRLLKHAAIIYGVALLIALPWYIRNVNLYGNLDILGLNRHDEIVVGQLRTTDYLDQVGVTNYISNFATTTFHSYWGQFGWMAVPMDQRTYTLLVVLLLVSIGGLVGFAIAAFTPTPASIQPNSEQSRALWLMAIAILLMAVAFGWYNLGFVQFQGRYLFPVLIPAGVLFSLGLYEALSQRWAKWLAGGLLLALIWITASGLLSGGLDKWAILIIGLALVVVVVRIFLLTYWLIITRAIFIACYVGLAFLTLMSPFWFVEPYL